MKKILSYFIFILTFQLGHAQANLKMVEYFLDSDNGIGLNTIVTVEEGQDISAAILTVLPTSISIGKHKLYFRTKDSNNQWSQTIRKSITIIPTQVSNTIITAEYFLDADPSFGSGTTFEINPKTEAIDQAFMTQIEQTANIGFHKLFGRVRDNFGHWSMTFRKNIHVIENPDKTIVALEYFFNPDLEFANNTVMTLEPPGPDGSWLFKVPYPSGPYSFDDVLFVRAKDNTATWSQTTILNKLDSSLSVVQVADNNHLKIYPNPVKNVITFASSLHFVVKTVKLYDMTGRHILSRNGNMRTLNLNHLNVGIYTLILTTTIGNATYKIIKR